MLLLRTITLVALHNFYETYKTWQNEAAATGACMDGRTRSHIKPGLAVRIVLKKDQRSGTLTEGIVQAILTKSPTHPHGIKVRLVSGEVGRVKEICGQ